MVSFSFPYPNEHKKAKQRQWQELQLLLPPLPLMEMEASLLVAPKPSMPRTVSSIFSARRPARRWRCLAVAATTKVTCFLGSMPTSIFPDRFLIHTDRRPILVMCKTAPLGKRQCQCPGAAPSAKQAANDGGSSRARRPARRRRRSRHGSATTMSSFTSRRGGGIGTVAGGHPVPRGGGAG